MEEVSTHRQLYRLPRALVALIFLLTLLPLLLAVFGVGEEEHFPWPGGAINWTQEPVVENLRPLVLHAVLDWVALLGIFTMAFLALLRYRLSREVFAPLTGLCFLGGGFIIAVHVLASSNLWPGMAFTRATLFNTLLVARAFFPVLFILGLFVLERAQPLRKSNYATILKQAGTLAFVLSVCGIVLAWVLAPVGGLLPFATPINFLIAMGYVGAGLFVFYVGRKVYPGYFSEALLLSFVPLSLAQFLFLANGNQMLNATDLYAHALMVMGFFIPFGGITIDYVHTYHRKSQSARELRKLQRELLRRSEQLQEANRAMRQQIKEREQAEARLKQSEERARMIIETATDAFIGIDEQGRITEWNHQAEVTFGWSKEEILGQSIYEKILLPPFARAFAEEIARYLETHSSAFIFNQIELNTRHRNGHQFVVELSLWPIRIGDGYQFFAFVRDISERKRMMEQQTRLVRELERANKELQDFAYVVSHDLKAPLRAIASLANWLYADYANQLDQEGKEQLTLLVSRVKRMHNLIEGVLQYSKAGMKRTEKTFVNLDNLVRDVVDLLVPPDRFEVIIPEKLPTILADRTHLLHIFQNLISNAVKFMDKPKGKIQITCCETTHQWTFCVLDNGPGIEPSQQEKIFQIFQTIHSRDEVENTGIGLALVKKIVEMNSGKIWVESTPGKGSAFYFTIPKSEVYEDELSEILKT